MNKEEEVIHCLGLKEAGMREDLKEKINEVDLKGELKPGKTNNRCSISLLIKY